MDLLNVSRSTLREGLHLLEEERIIRTSQGIGRFLVSVPGDYKFDITHFKAPHRCGGLWASN
jgi:DNA-binding GntR family transcriptional regulator